MRSVEKENKTLYKLDFGEWIDQQVIALKNKDVTALDWVNLQEEIESLGASDKRAINSLTRQLLIHLLLYAYWTVNRDFYLSGWKIEINNFRNDLSDFLDSRNYYQHFENNLDKNYNKALKQVNLKAENANLSLNLPLKYPFTIEQILDDDWYPPLLNIDSKL
ncbi:DUF29 domain-containing protein [Crocosphaera chwakensis]|uniref:DUF29 domain-containing protein n=1 Tax=Crocosphaera chwakensis CCY0110 TaxID=391612 RepID=A3IHQ8_9CHRO|nr:DUF29 domain-containing protein [Crocosphaera chwakensis]EAZ93340.1 hypothetical protein CY0110_16132 [Crocosphaera chwakensis CCY0110]